MQRNICNLALTSKQTINSALKKMEKQGLLRLCLFHGAEQRHGFRCDLLCTDAGLSDLPIFLELNGIWLSILVAEFLGILVTASLLIANRKKYSYF